MSTMVGASARVRMRGNYLFTPLFEDTADRRPRIASFNKMPAGASELRTAGRVVQERNHGVSELTWLVGAGVVESRFDPEPLGADCCRHHRTRHRQSFEDLQPRSA